jgi:hypothetical protein
MAPAAPPAPVSLLMVVNSAARIAPLCRRTKLSLFRLFLGAGGKPASGQKERGCAAEAGFRPGSAPRASASERAQRYFGKGRCPDFAAFVFDKTA